VFRIYDEDHDFVLNSEELNRFQVLLIDFEVRFACTAGGMYECVVGVHVYSVYAQVYVGVMVHTCPPPQTNGVAVTVAAITAATVAIVSLCGH
jgi:hypothetical protein